MKLNAVQPGATLLHPCDGYTMPVRSFLAILGLCTLGPFCLLSRAQSSDAPPSDASPTLTLQANSRIVLTDVTVTDRKGNPVHGLPASIFHIFDNNQPEKIASFDEHTGAPSVSTPIAAASGGVYSNDYIQHLPSVLNVLVLDTTNLELPDQMYLSFQLNKFVNTLPKDQPIAIFARHGDNAVLLQNFTPDHTLLLAAIRKALPRIPLPGRELRSDTDTLHQIGSYLSQIPGRKNILWFSGGSTFFLLNGLSAINAPGAAGATGSPPSAAIIANESGGDIGSLRQVYDELEAARIAVYPIDARGLTVENDAAYGAQEAQMNDIAQSTGGQAYYNRNGLAQIAGHIVSTDSSAYALSYSPRNLTYDNKWHTVKVTLEGGPYTLSYRRGYFADPPHTLTPGTKNPHPLILAGDSSPTAAPDIHSSPLIFQADVRPAANAPAPSETGFIPLRPLTPPEKGATSFVVDYSLSTSALTAATVDGGPHATVDFAVIAFNNNGDRVAQSLDRVRFPLKPDGPPKQLKVEQQIDLHKGGAFLSLVVWDASSGHLGTLQIPLQVNSAPKSK